MNDDRTNQLAPGDQAPDVELTAPDGSVVRTSELWRDHSLVLAFMRHFG